MEPNESLERLSLVLIGIAVGVLVGAVLHEIQVASYGVWIIEIFLFVTIFFLREVAYKKGSK